MRALLLAAIATAPLGASAQTPIGAAAPQVSATAPLDDGLGPWRATRWALLGSGVTALLAGAVVYGLGAGQQSDLDALIAETDDQSRVTGISQAEAFRSEDRIATLRTSGAVGLAAGGVLIVAGLVTWALEPDPVPCAAPVAPEPEVRPFSLLPTLGPDGPGLAFGLRF